MRLQPHRAHYVDSTTLLRSRLNGARFREFFDVSSAIAEFREDCIGVFARKWWRPGFFRGQTFEAHGTPDELRLARLWMFHFFRYPEMKDLRVLQNFFHVI